MDLKKSTILFIILIFSVIIISCWFFFFGFENGIGKLSNDEKARNDFIQNDSLKLISLNFLLENSEDKYSSGYTKRIRRKDKFIISKHFFFRNIEQAIAQSTERLNNNLFTTDQFLNYILPYRIGYEEPENWRAFALDSTKDCYNVDILIHAKNINDKIRKRFKYTNSRANRKLSNLLSDKYGSCNEMSDIAAFGMRANGLPVAIDFAKWSSTFGKHQWNSLITKDRNYPFMGCESNPAVEKTPDTFGGKAAKFYRKSFKKYDDKFESYNPKKVINPVNYIDVTKEYCPDCKNIVIEFPNESLNDDVFFLCIYEVDNWIPIDFAYVEKTNLIYKDVCPNNIFILKKRIGNNLEYFKTPFTLDSLGSINFVSANQDDQERLELTFDNSPLRELRKSEEELGMKKTTEVKDSIWQYNFTAIVKDITIYTLYFWDNEWVKIADKKPKNNLLVFQNAPKNALYKLEDLNVPNSFRYRCFTVDENNQQRWW